MAGRRGPSAGRDPPRDPGRGAIKPRPSDRRRGTPLRHEVHRPAGAPHRDQRSRLPQQRQRAARSAVRLRHRVSPERPGHECRGRGQGRATPRGRREGLRHPRRRLQHRRRPRLRLLRPGTRAAGRRDGPANRPPGDRHRQCRHPGRVGGRVGGNERQHPGARHRRPPAEGPPGGQRASPRRGHRRAMSVSAAASRAPRSPPTATMSAPATASRPQA